jgi:aminocarboxymuconate-semialdehyde decarboxylase
MICDVHAHCMPKAVEEIFDDLEHVGLVRPKYGWPGPPFSDSDADADARLALMDGAGVQVQVLSLALPMVGDEAVTVNLVQRANDAMAHMAARHPDRFLVYAELPMPYLDSSLKELERCRSQLGFEAVSLLASSLTTSAVAEEFDPLYEELDSSRALVFFHPRGSGLCSALISDFGLNTSLGPVFEDTLLVCQMVRRQFPQRFPNLKMIIPHLGGVLPIFLQRMDNQMGLLFPELLERPSDTARRLWYDTVSHGSVPALRSAWESLGVDRLVPGSDYPVTEYHDGYKANIDYIRNAGLPEADVEQILHLNAPRLFGLAAPANESTAARTDTA